MSSPYTNAATGQSPVDPEDYLPAPKGATHFDTCHMTIFHWHKQIDGEWAYFDDIIGKWKVYQTQEAATVEDFITI